MFVPGKAEVKQVAQPAQDRPAVPDVLYQIPDRKRQIEKSLATKNKIEKPVQKNM